MVTSNPLMVTSKALLVAALAALAVATPTSDSFWKGTMLGSSVEEMRSMCANDDALACIKYKFMTFLDSVLNKESFQLTDNVEVTRNSFRANEVSARGEGSLDENVEDYLKSHDVTVRLPIVGSAVMIGARNLDSDELDLKLKFSDSEEEITESRHKKRKSKLKKIIVPILVFVLLKAITLIPLALGVLGLKAWNALQLSFFSFVISIALAIFQLCKKIAADGTPPQIASHGPWEYAARSFVEAVTQGAQAADAQQLAYSAYA